MLPNIRGGHRANYTNDKGKEIPCVVMGNLGDNPEDWHDLTTRNVEPEQIRSIGLSALSLRKDPFPEFKLEERLARNGTKTFNHWVELIIRLMIKFGFDALCLFIRVILASGDIKYYHILKDKSKLDTKKVQEHCDWYGRLSIW